MLVRQIPHFDLDAIMASGQCFRLCEKTPGTFLVPAGRRAVTVQALGDGRFAFDCTGSEFDEFWAGYFDLDTDYGGMIHSIDPSDGYLLRAAEYGSGLRILRQDPWETLISFILSQRKSIPAIRDCVERLCACFGEETDGALCAFPTPAALAGAQEAALRGCALGYRAPYVLKTARAVAEGQIDLKALRALDDEAMRRTLMTLPGVGVKVANCVMLFGYHRLCASPVDVWIQRVIDEQYGGISPFARYGENAGVMQQYMFFYRRGQRR